MRQGKSLIELANELTRIQEAKKDYVVPTSKLSMNEDGKLEFVNGVKNELSLTNWSAGQVASYTDIPKQYFDRIREESPFLLSEMVNHSLGMNTRNGEREGRLIRVLDGKVRGFLSPKYRILDGHDLLEATLPSLLDNKFEVMSSEVTEKRLYLKAITKKIEGEVKKGDVVQYGVMLSTSDVGAGSLKVEPFFMRLACLNGMVMETKFRKAHLGASKFEAEVQELLTDNTRRLNDQAFFATVRDYLTATMSPINFERELNKMRVAADRKIENFDLEKVVEVSMNEVGVKGESVKKGILAALANGNEGAGLTQWGLANSFTNFAKNETLDYDLATDLERAGGSILELSPTQWRKVAVGA
jgi:hypothetical protein